MSYAQVMASLNETSAASGVEVEVKKRAPDGSYVPADGRDFATADFDAELEAALEGRYHNPCVLKMLREVTPTVHPVCDVLA